jgi:uncharacterized protein with gpF-like domain
MVALLCAQKTPHKMEESRDSLEKNFHHAIVQTLNFAKHETLRKLHRHLYSQRPIKAQQEGDPHHDAVKIAFEQAALGQDLNATITFEIPPVLDAGVQDTLDAAGSEIEYRLPMQDALDFIAQRQNLLSGVPDEIYQQIQTEISAGLKAGESLSQISQRITKVFDEIASGRASVIAATETAAAYGFASNQAAVAAGVPYKKWLHSVIPKVPRPDHIAIDGLIVPMNQPFPVGDPQLMYPHDGNGSPEDVINCRCLALPVGEEEYLAQK